MTVSIFFRQGYFTLIELLVVIGIIAVMAAMLLPSLGAVRERGRAAACAGNLRQLAMANMTYSCDNDGFFAPYARFSAHSAPGFPYPLWWGLRTGSDHALYNEGGFLSAYLNGNPKVLICESASQLVDFGTADGGGYGYNANGVGGTGYITMGPDKPQSSTDAAEFGKSVNVSMLTRSSSLIMFADSVNAGGMGTAPAELRPIDRVYGPDSYAYIHFRHNGKANIGWTDGHVSAESCSSEVDSSKYALALLGDGEVGHIFPVNTGLPVDHTYYDTYGRADPAGAYKK